MGIKADTKGERMLLEQENRYRGGGKRNDQKKLLEKCHNETFFFFFVCGYKNKGKERLVHLQGQPGLLGQLALQRELCL